MFMGSWLDVKAVLRIAFKKSAQKKVEKKQFMTRKVQKRGSINNSAQIINHDVI